MRSVHCVPLQFSGQESLALRPGLASLDHCKKAQTRGLNTTEIYSVTLLEVRIPKSGYGQEQLPPTPAGESLFLRLPPGCPWVRPPSWAFLCCLLERFSLCLSHHRPFSLCGSASLCLFSSSNDTSRTGSRAHCTPA